MQKKILQKLNSTNEKNLKTNTKDKKLQKNIKKHKLKIQRKDY